MQKLNAMLTPLAFSAIGGGNYLDGEAGNNTLWADGGDNQLVAGAGNDTLAAWGGGSDAANDAKERMCA